MAGPFAHILHATTIARLARDVTLERGRAYAAQGRVRAMTRRGTQIVAAVQGSAFYAVALWVSAAGFGYVCSCPVGADGKFCKHCVAVAFAWTERNPAPGVTPNDVMLETHDPNRLGRPFAHVLHSDTITKLARGTTLENGRLYATDGRVRTIARKGTQIVGTVEGESFYPVSLWVSPEGLGYICACPVGADGMFCKHCVAVAYAWVDRNPA